MVLGLEGGEHIAVLIFNTGDDNGFGTNTLVGEGGIGVHHFPNGHFAGTQAEADNGVYLTLDSEGAHEFDELFRRKEGHEVCGYPVGRFRQAPSERNGIALVLGMIITRHPAYAVSVKECN